MKKGALFIISLIIISFISSSCNQSKSLQELIQEEQKAIDKFIIMNDFVILKNYPSNGVFKENEYYKTPDGLFFHVVDSGNGKRVKAIDEVSVRFNYSQGIKDVASGDTSKWNYPLTPSYYSSPYLSAFQPYSFTFGISATYQSANIPICQGWIIPLSYVGENGVVDLIIPSSIGSSLDNSAITPVFYKNLRYTKFN